MVQFPTQQASNQRSMAYKLYNFILGNENHMIISKKQVFLANHFLVYTISYHTEFFRRNTMKKLSQNLLFYQQTRKQYILFNDVIILQRHSVSSIKIHST